MLAVIVINSVVMVTEIGSVTKNEQMQSKPSEVNKVKRSNLESFYLVLYGLIAILALIGLIIAKVSYGTSLEIIFLILMAILLYL